MGKLYLKYLDGANIYACNNCKAHLALHDDIISKNFHGRHGKAYLFNRAVNVLSGPSEERSLMTGLHVVCDIYCLGCSTIVGWKYEDAYEESQKYKVGKYILEKAKLSKVNGWQQDLQSQMEHSSDDESVNRAQQELDDDEEDHITNARQQAFQSIRRLVSVRPASSNPTSRFIQQVLRTGSTMEDEEDDGSSSDQST